MNKKDAHQPPRWADRFLEWYCKPSLLEDLQGDLYEHYERHLKAYGQRRARRKYIYNVLKFFKPYTIKNIEILNQLTQFIMFKNYFKTSVRSIARNKLFSFINVFGLAVSMSVCLLMISMYTEISGYDRFHKDVENIYRINNYQRYQQRDGLRFASTSILLGKRMKNEVPGIESLTIIKSGAGGDATIGENTFPIDALYGDEEFFDVLTFKLLRGNKDQALQEPNSIVITDETAVKLFKEKDPLDQIIKLKDTDYRVTGVMEKPPFNSHIKFQALVSFATYQQEMEANTKENNWMSWENMWNNYIYFRPEKGITIDDIQSRLDLICEEENQQLEHTTISTIIQPITSIMTGSVKTSNEIGFVIGKEILLVMAGLSFIVILSAAFNYTNLSIARSLRRSKEVGIRKVVGAKRAQVFTQFIVEACIMSLASLIIAYLLFNLIKPFFLNINPDIQEIFQLNLDAKQIIYFVLFALAVGVTAGFLPATFLSRLKAISVLKSNNNTKLFSKVNLRKSLIVTQFTLSIIFIISASISRTQFNFALNYDLGFETDNIINVQLEGNDPTLARTLFESIPEVETISMSSHVLSVGSTWGNQMFSEDKLDSGTVFYSQIDHNYIPMMNHKLIAGSNFPEKVSIENEEHLILNEKALKEFKLGTPEEAVGKIVNFDSKNLMIIGVVEDFNNQTIQSEIKSFAFRHNIENAYVLNLKLSSADMVATREKLESAWNQFDPIHEFNASFYKDSLEQAYKEFSMLYTIIGFLAFLTISISALGLLGMGVYTAETRLKEISIRKVLGASEQSLVRLLSQNFLILLIIAAAIAIPIAYFIFDSLILADQAFRAPIGLLELCLGVIIIFIIGFITIGSQTWKAARANPATTLRAE